VRGARTSASRPAATRCPSPRGPTASPCPACSPCACAACRAAELDHLPGEAGRADAVRRSPPAAPPPTRSRAPEAQPPAFLQETTTTHAYAYTLLSGQSTRGNDGGRGFRF